MVEVSCWIRDKVIGWIYFSRILSQLFTRWITVTFCSVNWTKTFFIFSSTELCSGWVIGTAWRLASIVCGQHFTSNGISSKAAWLIYINHIKVPHKVCLNCLNGRLGHLILYRYLKDMLFQIFLFGTTRPWPYIVYVYRDLAVLYHPCPSSHAYTGIDFHNFIFNEHSRNQVTDTRSSTPFCLLTGTEAASSSPYNQMVHNLPCK